LTKKSRLRSKQKKKMAPPSSADGANAATTSTPSADRERRLAAPAAAAAVLWRSFLRNTIYDVLRARPGWREAEPDGPWDFVWADKGCAAPRLFLARAHCLGARTGGVGAVVQVSSAGEAHH
jgi:hypothetical protein